MSGEQLQGAGASNPGTLVPSEGGTTASNTQTHNPGSTGNGHLTAEDAARLRAQ